MRIEFLRKTPVWRAMCMISINLRGARTIEDVSTGPSLIRCETTITHNKKEVVRQDDLFFEKDSQYGYSS